MYDIHIRPCTGVTDRVEWIGTSLGSHPIIAIVSLQDIAEGSPQPLFTQLLPYPSWWGRGHEPLSEVD